MNSQFEFSDLCDGFDATYEDDDNSKSSDSHRDRGKDRDRSKDKEHGRDRDRDRDRRRQERDNNRSRRHRDKSGSRGRSPIKSSDDGRNSGDDARSDSGYWDRIHSRDLDNRLSEDKGANIQPSHIIILRNLALDIDEKIIGAELLLLGLPFKDIRLIRRASGVSRGFAFVEFHNISDAQRWMEHTQGSVQLLNKCRANLAYGKTRDRDNNLRRNYWVCIKCLGHNFKRKDCCYNCDLSCKESEKGTSCYGQEEIGTDPCNNLSSQSVTAAVSTPATSDRQPAAPLVSTATTSVRQPAGPLASTATTSVRQPAAPLVSTETTSVRQPAAPLVSTATTSVRQPAAPLASTATTSVRQPAAPLASTATTSYRQSTESVQPADGAQLKSILDRLAVIEEAMCSFQSRTEKVAEQQSGIGQQLKELASKLSELDKKHSSGFQQVKQQISDVYETRDAIDKAQKTKLQSLEKQLQKISMAQDRQKAEMESQAELVEKLVHVPNLLESVKENIDALADRISGIIDDCRNTHEDIKTPSLVDKVMANTHSVQVISEGQDQMKTLLKHLETRLQTMEVDGGRNETDFRKQVEKGKSNFQILCQMLNDRLRPLEQLRTCLNERASMQDDNVTKLSQVIQEVAVMSPRLQQLEMKSPRTRCGFTARTLFAGEAASIAMIIQYKTADCNVGENFDVDSGIFTAPVDGLYVASVSICLSENEHLSVGVGYMQSLHQESSTPVCLSSAMMKQTTSCDVGVVDMKAGEVLVSYCNHIEKNNYLKEVYFSCFLLG